MLVRIWIRIKLMRIQNPDLLTYRQTPIVPHPFSVKNVFLENVFWQPFPPQKFWGMSKFGIYVTIEFSLQF